MGEQKDGEAKHSDAASGRGSATVVLKMELHCDGCAGKVKRVVEKFKGVEDVKIDGAANRITVTGKVDPTEIRDKLESKAKRKVEIVAAAPPPKAGGGNGVAEEKTRRQIAEEKEDKEKDKKETKEKDKEKVKETVVVLKTSLHCEGCIKKINKVIQKIKGVEFVSIDGPKELITVKGTMDTKELVSYLQNKLKRAVDVVMAPSQSSKPEPPAAKDKESTNKKGKEPATPSSSGNKKGSDEVAKKEVGAKKDAEGSTSSSGEPKMEVRKMEFQGYAPPQPSYWYGGNAYGPPNPIPTPNPEGYPNQAGQAYPYPYPHPYPYPYPYPDQGHYVNNDGYTMNPHVYAPQFFSDENPNACSIM